jgi:galactose mutarotase-like enzyme
MRATLMLWMSVALLAQAAGRHQIREERAAGPDAPMLVVLRDEATGIEAAIAPAKGGELSSLRVRHKGQWIETLYRARDYSDKPGWQGKAPLLWPATGRNHAPGAVRDPSVPEGSYDWNGRRYPMPIHGFARDRPWRVDSRRADDSAARATLSLSDSTETRRSYPFGFHLTVEYVLSEGRLDITYTIAASPKNTESMFFSIGNHITFQVPFLKGTDPEEMLFETPSTVEYLKSAQALPTGESRPRSLAKPVRLGDIDTRSAVSLGGYSGTPYMLLRDPQGLAIRIRHSAESVPPAPVILFNVWGDPREGYFSPEPWVGLQNSFNLHKGLVTIAPGGRWQWRIDIRPE